MNLSDIVLAAHQIKHHIENWIKKKKSIGCFLRKKVLCSTNENSCSVSNVGQILQESDDG